ncbi:P-loop containing nucleoside triphosphatehydrolases superfamily protein [Striga asiatica]|uniref:P-loop containing nucleoside triphosphatehydrolases superfamily protein n=1 Tax=Striga asiatica TaxID=4170 RepID=A0A5A7QTD7_STRAF|nr:P-loop containing nucleoside triphosphatehydrolases superfamily protein [Striga asiatica]
MTPPYYKPPKLNPYSRYTKSIPTPPPPPKLISDEVAESPTIPFKSDTLSCNVISNWAVLKLVVGFTLGTTGTSRSPNNIWATARIAGRASGSGLEHASPIIKTRPISSPSKSPPSLRSAAATKFPSLCKPHTQSTKFPPLSSLSMGRRPVATSSTTAP